MQSISKDELTNIVELAEALPQEYRQKCFELVLAHALQGNLAKSQPPISIPPAMTTDSVQQTFVLPIDVKAFLTQYSLNDAVLWKCFHAEGKEIRSIYQLKTLKKGRAQVEHALMLALETAMQIGQFQFTIGDLRQRCKDHNQYDGSNFAQHMKNNTRLFKNIPDFKTVANDEAIVLSSDGKAELAELLYKFRD